MSALLRLEPRQVIDERVRLADQFHRINRILPADQEVVSVRPETPVREAFDIMKKNTFSQVPVVDGKDVLGIFSYRSFSAKLLEIDPKKSDVLNLLVEDMMELANPTRFTHINNELSNILDGLARHDAILVGDRGRLQGIITTMDVLRYLQTISGRFVMLGEIEMCIRALLRAAFPGGELKNALDTVLKHFDEKSRPTRLEEMTFSQYATIVGHGACWIKCGQYFGSTRDAIRTKLELLAALRNDVFHFRRELEAADDAAIRDGREWLLYRAERLDKQLEKGANHE